MSENYSFRSSLNGFNRNDVMSCIENILGEKSAAEEKVSMLENSVSALEEKCSALEKDLAAAKNESEQRKSFYEKQFTDVKTVEIKADGLAKELEKVNAENESLRVLLAKAQENTAVKDKCAECDIARVYEARLGAAMLDAKRFSEILVKEANDKASGLFASASASADSTSVRAREIASEITAIKENLVSSFNTLLENMSNLESSLDSFKANVTATGTAYNFSTDFVSAKETETVKEAVDVIEPAENAVSAADEEIVAKTQPEEESRLHIKPDVNFDDADEFDIKVNLDAWKKY